MPQRKGYRLSNLVYLILEPDRDFVKPTRRRPEGVTVDPIAGTWSWDGSTHRIGQSDKYAYTQGSPVIGVYDRTKDGHLDEMTFAAGENARRNPEA